MQQVISGNILRNLKGITSDSRQVKEGWLFAAIDGVNIDGSKFIPQAVKAGAGAILCSTQADVPDIGEVILIRADNVREEYAKISAEYYYSASEFIVAITGTDGKTSVAEFVRQLWDFVGKKSASIGTLGITSSHLSKAESFPNTTPDAAILHRGLQAMKKAGIDHVAMEASSHGLDQRRLDGVKLKAAAFTTFGSDHGDYHGTVDAYFDAKARLFLELLPSNARVVLNGDCDRVRELGDRIQEKEGELLRPTSATARAATVRRKAACRLNTNIITFGHSKNADYRIVESTPMAEGLHAKLDIMGEKWEGDIPLYGEFQLMNVLTAMALIQAEDGISTEVLLAALPKLQTISGRLERIALHPDCGSPIFTDYAHTAQALENVLKSLRVHTEGNLHVVFGCGGDRDTEKRPAMGAVAARLADKIIITDDNPRSEDPATIRAAIIAACPNAIEISDRKQAIAQAISELKTGDILLIAGKGHESTQTIGDKVLHHHDGEVVLEILQ